MLGDDSRPSYCTGYQSNPLSDSTTGSTALRLAEVQHPKIVATWSCWISLRVFSANVGQSDAPSSMTGTIFLPITPPLALISSMASSVASFTEVSLMDIVPLSECSTPTLIVSAPLLALLELLPPLEAAGAAVRGAQAASKRLATTTATNAVGRLRG